MTKKLFIGAAALAATLVSNFSYAQYEVTYGLKGGYGFSRMRAPKTQDIQSTSRVARYNVMAYVDIPVTDRFSIQTGLAASGRGADIQVHDKESKTWYEYSMKPLYLELPVYFIGKIPIGDIFDKTNIVYGGGPYVSMGVGGKSSMSGKLLGVNVSDEGNVYYNNDDKAVNSDNFYGQLKHYDVGVNATVGVEYHWATLNLTYSYGAVNINPGANLTAIDRLKNRSLFISVGVKL